MEMRQVRKRVLLPATLIAIFFAKNHYFFLILLASFLSFSAHVLSFSAHVQFSLLASRLFSALFLFCSFNSRNDL